MVNLNLILWIASWFVVGLISVMIIWISDMRGKEFNENYFEEGSAFVFMVLVIFGYVSPFIVCYVFTSEKKYFTKLIYKIANIGLKKNN